MRSPDVQFAPTLVERAVGRLSNQIDPRPVDICASAIDTQHPDRHGERVEQLSNAVVDLATDMPNRRGTGDACVEDELGTIVVSERAHRCESRVHLVCPPGPR